MLNPGWGIPDGEARDTTRNRRTAFYHASLAARLAPEVQASCLLYGRAYVRAFTHNAVAQFSSSPQKYFEPLSPTCTMGRGLGWRVFWIVMSSVFRCKNKAHVNTAPKFCSCTTRIRKHKRNNLEQIVLAMVRNAISNHPVLPLWFDLPACTLNCGQELLPDGGQVPAASKLTNLKNTRRSL